MLKIDFIDFGTHESQTGFRREARSILAKVVMKEGQWHRGVGLPILFIALSLLVVLLDYNLFYPAKFYRWSCSTNGVNWFTCANPMRFYSGPKTFYVRGFFYSPYPTKKTYAEFGTADCISSAYLNGIKLDVSCNNSVNRKIGLDLSSYVTAGVNVVEFTIKNSNFWTIVFEKNVAMWEIIFYSLFLVFLLVILIWISTGYSKGDRRFVVISSTITTCFLFILLRYSLPMGVPGEFTYNRLVPIPSINYLLSPIFVFILVFPLVWWIDKTKKRNLKRIPLFLAVLALGLMLSVTSIESSVFEYLQGAIRSNQATGFFFQTTKVRDFRSILPEYHKIFPTFTTHANGHPPGYLYVLWEIQSVTTQYFPQDTASSISVIFAILFYILFGALSVVPVYYFTKRAYNIRIASYASLVYILSTSFINFTPSHDQINTLLVFTFLYYAYGGLIEKNKKETILAGLLFGLTTLFSFTHFILILFVTVWPFIKAANRRKVRETSKLLLLFFASFTLFHLIIYSLYEYNILKHFLALFGKHSDALRLGRTYWIWLIVQPVLFFIYTGIPTSILFFRRLITRFNEIKTETTIPFAITLLILSLSGIMGGEVPRMWMYFVPFVCMTAAKELESMGSKHIIYVIVILLFTQVILFKVCTVSSFMPWYTSL